jgi:hypothetical protein
VDLGRVDLETTSHAHVVATLGDDASGVETWCAHGQEISGLCRQGTFTSVHVVLGDIHLNTFGFGLFLLSK